MLSISLMVLQAWTVCLSLILSLAAGQHFLSRNKSCLQQSSQVQTLIDMFFKTVRFKENKLSFALGTQMDHVTQIFILLTTVLQQQTAHTGIHRHFFIVKEALCQVSEKCILSHMYVHRSPEKKLEISRAVTQYSTRTMVSSL